MNGLGELKEEPKAIFWQKSKMTQNEFALISMVTLREQLLKKLKKCISDVKNNFRDADLACITETMQLVHAVRESTYDLIEGVQMWQQGFTKNIRPQLMSVDYLVDLIDCMQFFGQSGLRRTFVFTTGVPGNIFLLPMPAMSVKRPPNKCDEALFEAVNHFASPDESRMINCLKIMQNSLPPHEFKRIMPLPTWLNNRWVPNVCLVKEKIQAEDFYKISDGLDANIVRQTRFLRRKRRDAFGREIEDEVEDKKELRPGTGASVDGGASLINSSSQVFGATIDVAGTSTADDAAITTAAAAAASPVKTKEPKKKDYGPVVDPVTGKVNSAAIIAEQFGAKAPNSFGSSIVVHKEFTKNKDYKSKRFNAFSMDKLFNWDDLDDDLPREKKVDGVKAALAAKEARENKSKGFEAMEEERRQAILAKQREAKGMQSMRPPSPPKTVEERNDRLVAAGISTGSLSDTFKAAHGLPPNTVTLAEKKKLARARAALASAGTS